MKRVSSSQSLRIAQLEQKLGSRTLRTILTSENQRLMRPERLSNLLTGSGKLSESEIDRLQLASSNAQQLSNLQKRGSGKLPWKVNRSLRDWLAYGKTKSQSWKDMSEEERKQGLKAIRALRFLGIDPSDGTYYVLKRKG